MLRALLLLLAASSLLGGPGVQAGPPSVAPWSVAPSNIKGDTLILDVGSLNYQGNHPVFPMYNQDGCAAACLRTPGCNAWTYCGAKEGCGSGCLAYTAKNPQLSPAPNANPTIPNPAWRQLPSITGFGPWGRTASCQYACDSSGSCKPNDRFPFGMCSLKKLADPKAPQFWSTNAGEGWVSGFWAPPPECKGLSGRACQRCAASKDPPGCLACARAATDAGAPFLDAAVNASLTAADGCGACYNAAQPAKCVACLTGGAACGACALQELSDPAAALDVSACVDCTAQRGPRFRDACVACAALGARPQQQRSCMACLAAMQPLACDSTDYQAPCWNPAQRSSSCATCASSAQSFDACLACMRASPFSENCGACAVLPGEKQAACYSCSKAAAHPGSGCADCLNYVKDPASLQQCVGCLADRRIGTEGKSWCFGCQNWCGSFAERAKCVSCLGTQQSAYMSACACKR